MVAGSDGRAGRPVFLGVDGGGTKTALCLLRDDGTVLAQTQAEGSYYFTAGIDLVERVLSDGVTRVCGEAGIDPADIDCAFFGLPGYGEVSGDMPRLDAAAASVLGHDRYRCDNDMVCAWAGSLGATDGINVISGTGSMTYGEHAGAAVRVGGWGEVFGDDGSAHWIAVRGLNAASRMSDGRLPEGPLLHVLRRHLALKRDLDLIDVVLNQWRGARAEVAALSVQVVRAAELGDVEAAGILTEAGRELAALVDATRTRLGYAAGEPVPVSHSGGVFSAAGVHDAFQRRLQALSSDYRLRRPLFSPVIGAALYAARLAGTPLTDDARAALRREAGNVG